LKVSESIIVVVACLIVYGLFGYMAHKAELVVKAQKLAELQAVKESIAVKAGQAKTKKRQ
jgi:hypothetical protein